MNYFFTFLLQPILPIALLLGCLWTNYNKFNFKAITWLTIIGFSLGTIFAIHFLTGQKVILTFNCILFAIYVFFYFSQLLNKLWLAHFWQFILSFVAGSLWGSDPNIHLITNTDVINTPFLLNLSAVIGGFIFCIFITTWLSLLFKQSKKDNKLNTLRWLLLTVLTILSLLPLTGHILLNLMKLQAINLTSMRLTFSAKAGDITSLFNYINAAILSIILIIFALKVYLPRKKYALEEKQPIEKRKKLAYQQTAKRILIFGTFAVIAIFSSQLYWDKVASLPPQLSEATQVKINKADNSIHIPIESVKDGDLHRFVWVASDGKAIRFFIINRSTKKQSLATVFDACLLCGDQGYVKESADKIICVACGVRLFIPSVGKPGGCNPIPIDNWQETTTDVVIPKKSLLTGKQYFSTTIEIEVTDPVSLEKLTNIKADYRYDYNDNTYFFTSEKNQNLFRENPEPYVKKLEEIEAAAEAAKAQKENK